MELSVFVLLLCAHDFRAFVERAFLVVYPGQVLTPNWHITALAYFAMSKLGKPGTYVINLPPRSLKSFIFSVCWPAWILGNDPREQILCISYNDALAFQFSMECRRLMESSFFRQMFPKCRLDPRETNRAVMRTTRNGRRHAASMQGGITGFGCNKIVIDDPMKSSDATSTVTLQGVIDTYRNTILSRFNKPNEGVLLLVQQRQHEGDLTGHLVETQGIVPLVIPAIAVADQDYALGAGRTYHRPAGQALQPALSSADKLAEIRTQIGSLVFEAQYQQEPVAAGGNLIKTEWFQRRYSHSAVPAFRDVILAADTASKTGEHNDWSVLTVLGIVDAQSIYVLDVIRGRWTYPELLRQVLGAATTNGPNRLLIEDAGSGIQLIQDLQANHAHNVIPVTPRGNKVDRCLEIAPMIEGNKLVLPEDAPWLGPWLTEIAGFPNAKHDDQVDSLGIGLRWVQENPEVHIQLYPPESFERESYWQQA